MFAARIQFAPLLRLLEKQKALHLPVFSIFFFFFTAFPGIGEFATEKHFTEYQAAIQFSYLLL